MSVYGELRLLVEEIQDLEALAARAVDLGRRLFSDSA